MSAVDRALHLSEEGWLVQRLESKEARNVNKRPTATRIFLTAMAALVLSATGCKGQCRQLSEKLCECSTNSAEKDACLRRASSRESGITLTPENETTCAALLPKCDCKLIDTAEGKVNCGLARPSPAQ